MGARLNILDLAFLGLETQRTPVNVASLQTFDPPADAGEDYVRKMLEQMRQHKPGPPFNLKLAAGGMTSWPQWVVDRRFDIEYHVRHSALPRPGTMDDLLDLVSRLHSRLMDRERPLWEFHLIEGLANGGFAIYTKMHHAAIDGMGGIALLEACLNDTPDGPMKAPWGGLSRKQKGTGKALFPSPGKLLKQLRAQIGVTTDLGKLFMGHGLKLAGLRADYSPPMFIAPPTPFNVPVSAARRFMTHTLSLSAIKQLAKDTDATVNDIVLTVCSGALRKYLRDRHKLPNKTLVATVPVSIRQINRTGNQITYVSAKLATQRRSPLTRLAEISQSTRHAKQELADVSPDAAVGFAVIAQGLVAVMNRLHTSNLLPPPANVVISNVPGPRRPLYFGGALLRANYPLSVLVDGQALNITVMSYLDSVDFGLMACREAVPDVEQIADGIGEAFAQLQAAAAKRNRLSPKTSDARSAPAPAGATRAPALRARAGRPAPSKRAAGGKKTDTASAPAVASTAAPPATKPTAKKLRRKKTTAKKPAVAKAVGKKARAARQDSKPADRPADRPKTAPKPASKATKKVTTRKAAASKPAAKKAGVKAAVKPVKAQSAASKKAGKKATAKKSATRKTPTRKATAKKTATRKAATRKATAKKTATRKTATRKATAKKTATRKATPKAVSSSGRPIRSLRDRRAD